jgi:hypothetical protein
MPAIDALERLKFEFGGGAAAQKLALLEKLERARLPTARQVLRLHEALLFLRAYPDDAAVLGRVERMLEAFARRADLRRHRRALADSGIAGTEIRYPFFAATARWVAERWPERLYVDWAAFERREELGAIVHLLAHFAETPALDALDFGARGWIDRMRGRSTDGAFLVRRFHALSMDDFAREAFYDQLDPPLRLAPAPLPPSRTSARLPVARIAFQTRPPRRERPDLRAEARRRPRRVRALAREEARRVVDLARETLVTRGRDLDAFAYASERDVRLVDWEDGLSIAFLGMVPERRLLLESVYGLLLLQNGVPVGYLATSALFGSAEVAFNVFETFRGAGAARLLARVLASVRHLFRADTFTLDPYQLGENNDEALRSGAWWFYQKLGFRARDPAVLRLMERELAAMRRNPGRRSSVATLRRLAKANVFLSLSRARNDVLGAVDLSRIGLAVTDLLARRFGEDPDRGARACVREAERVLRGAGAGGPWFARWAPLVLALPGVERWSAAERRALLAVIRAKGGPRESEYVLRFDRHRKLRRALLALAAQGGGT